MQLPMAYAIMAAMSDSGEAGPPCRKCGAPMLLRTSTRGNRIGEQFWGCSRFPDCWHRVWPSPEDGTVEAGERGHDCGVATDSANVARTPPDVSETAWTPLCSKCGGQMLPRVAKRGKNRGQRFWGCENFSSDPQCRNLVPQCSCGKRMRRSGPSDASGRKGDWQCVGDAGCGATLPGVPLSGPDCATPRARPPARDTGGPSDAPLSVSASPRNRSPARNAADPKRELAPRNRVARDGSDSNSAALAAEAAGSVRHGRDGEGETRRVWVRWEDASTTDRGEWTARYTTVGVSLRSNPTPQWARVANCWIACDRAGTGREDVQRSVAVLMKMMARGTAPPMHPDSERLLVEMVGERATEIVASDFAAPAGDGTIDLSLAESEAEATLMSYFESRSRTAAKSLVAQPLLDTLVTARSNPRTTRRASRRHGDSQRRCDFLFAPSGAAPTVIEVDGTQHRSARAEDRQRDEELRRVGVKVLRIPTSKLWGTPNLAGVDELIASVPEANETSRVVWGSVQTHRLVAAICEALTAGLLHGDTWSIALIDGTETAASLVGPYLGLLAAVDAATGGSAAPAVARLGTGGKVVEWRLVGPYCYERRDVDESLDPRRADLRIALHYEESSCDVLPASDATATVIVRSCAVPASISDPTSEPVGEGTLDGVSQVPREAVEAVSYAVFGMSELRAGQYEAINELLCGRDCVVLLPTGGGKSLIYQVAGLLTTGRTLVVDPIVSLIDDQIAGLVAHGIDRTAAVYHGSDELKQSKDAHWVFVAPERLQRTKFRDSLKENAADAPIRLAVVDEAHCVSEWGHSFRPAYLNFGKVLRAACASRQGPPRIAALTGTASRPVLADLLHHLGIANSNPNSIVKPDSFDRPELSYEVVICRPEQQMGTLREVIGALPPRFGLGPGEFFAATGSDQDTYSGIVFVPTVSGRKTGGIDRTAQEIAPLIVGGVAPARYSGKAPKSEDSKTWDEVKARHADSFKSNQTPVMVATKAFGMGIDKANVRYTVHLGLPQSIEGFY